MMDVDREVPATWEDAETFIVTPEEAGTRLDQFCQTQLEGFSRSRCQALIESAQVRVGDKPAKASQKLKPGELVSILVPPPAETEVRAEAIPLDVVFEDSEMIVVNKPQGMVVHPAPGAATGTLVNALLHHVKDLSGIGGVARPGIVHRLDKDTSGVMVVAKNDRAHQSLAGQIGEKTALRQYWAVIRGHLKETEGRVEGPIARHPVHRKRMAVVEGGRYAATQWRVLENYKGFSLVELTLETGRTHQIRVHMAYLGHPVVGDTVYGGDVNVPVKLAGQALHARRLRLKHPVTGEEMTFEAPPPENFQKLLNYMAQTR
jgi:23S rRNA pseudouridine1911/1915/1917 synthase